MKKCPWKKIDNFQSYFEFEQFVDWMNTQIELKIAAELPVKSPYSGTTLFQEKWFSHIDSCQVWRLVWPDAPFEGIFEQVK